MHALSLPQFIKRSKQVDLLIDRALLITEGAQEWPDAEFGKLVFEKYNRVLNRLRAYRENLRIRLQAFMNQKSAANC